MDRVEYSKKLADLISNVGYCKEGSDLEDRKEAVTDPR